MSYKKDRQFSIPYSTNIEPKKYLKFIQNYSDNIENIFLGLPEIDDHVSLQLGDGYNFNNTYEFLELSKNKYKRIVTFNSFYYDMDYIDLVDFTERKIYPLIEKYNIDGFIVTNLGIAERLHRDFPKLEMHTSCNCHQFTIRQMEQWRKIAGISVFNPPREIARMPRLLKEMHDAGFKLKVLVNEACSFGCPYQLNHACAISGLIDGYIMCNSDILNAFRSNFYLPKWLDYIDEYVDIYKISGRYSSMSRLKTVFDAYILQKDNVKYINDIAEYGENNSINYFEYQYKKKIPLDYIPEKVRWCESKECEKTCFECKNAFDKLINAK